MKLGVTGGIGSGKSLVVDTLEQLGAVVYRADSKAKELVYRTHIRAQITELFGENAFENNYYNTKYISSIVFSNETMLQKLNGIIHPEVFKDLDNFCREHREKTIVYESALMIETGHTHLFDKIILVIAPLELKIERVMKRDNTDRLSVVKRVEKQWTDEQKIPYADIIIENTDKIKTIEQVNQLWKNEFK